MRPSPVLARIRSRSNSASPPSTVSMSRPCGVVVSAQASPSDLKAAPAWPTASRMLSKSRVLRASWSRRNILSSPDFQRRGFEVEDVGRRLNLAHFQHGEAISSIGQDRQMAQTRDDLAQDFKTFGSQIGSLTRQSSDVAARSRQTGDKAAGDRVSCRREYDRDH